MRTLSLNAINKIQQSDNIEPVIIVQVYWSGIDSLPTKYCDRRYETEGLVGRLLEISGINDVVDISSASGSTSLNVLLDDSLGDIKNIFDQKDIHKTFVQVLQWFDGLSLNDAFSIFEGEIATPIVWDEGARTLQFDVLSQIEDREVGYSFEEADVPTIPAQLIGQTIPLVFGQVRGLRPIPLNLTPSLIISSGFGVLDYDQADREVAEIEVKIQEAYDKARAAWQAGLAEAIIASRYKTFGSLADDPAQADQHDQAAFSYFVQSDQYMAEREQLQFELQNLKQLTAEQENISISRSGTMPADIKVSVNNFPKPVGSAFESFSGQFANYVATITVALATPAKLMRIDNINLLTDTKIKIGTLDYRFASEEEDGVTNAYERTGERQKFVWIDGGTEIKVFGYPRYFFVGMGNIQVVNVWATSKYGRRPVPNNLYTVVPGSELVPTQLIFPIALEAFDGDWQSGTIEVDCFGGLTNAVDIMAYVINRFSGLEADSASFIATRPTVFNCDFAITSRMNTLTFLKEMAFQSRCALWMKDKRVYIKNLATSSSPVAEFTESDIEVASLKITCTPTEELVTKFVALWRWDYNSEQNEAILRYNIKRYGVMEKRYDFFIYNQYNFVQKVAEFWSSRYANTWKLCTFKVNLNHLAVEMFDTVRLTFNEPLLANGPVDCLVRSANFNSSDDSIDMEVWVPIRFGEMQVYNFAYPRDTQLIYPDKNDPNIQTGNPLEGFSLPLPEARLYPRQWQIVNRSPAAIDSGSGQSAGSFAPANSPPDPEPTANVTALDPFDVDTPWRSAEVGGKPRPDNLDKANNKVNRDLKALTTPNFKNVVPNVFYGIVVGGFFDDSTGFYTAECSVYLQGLTSPPSAINVRIPALLPDTVFPLNYPLVIYRTVFTVATSNGSETVFEYWAQPPIWAPVVSTED